MKRKQKKRSLTNFGCSVAVTLPKSWTKKNNISAKSVLKIQQQANGVLVVTPVPEKQIFRSAIKTSSSLLITLPNEWLKKHKLGTKDFVKMEERGRAVHIKRAR